jgi:hypothetical protein
VDDRQALIQFLQIIDNNLLSNCPINRRDILAAEDIFGPEIGSLKGKSVRHSGEAVTTVAISLPADLMACDEDVTSGRRHYVCQHNSVHCYHFAFF